MVNTRVRTAALLLGIGLGGFVDGILLHQVLQWHNMLSAVVPPATMEAMQLNMRADGLFHAAAWAATFAGVLVLWSAFGRGGTLPSTRFFLGTLLAGWGWFNLVEGLVNHHVFGLHHVRDLPEHVPAFDWAFLLVGGIGFIAAGTLVRNSAPRKLPERRAGYDRRALE